MFVVTTLVALVLLFSYHTSRGPDQNLDTVISAGGNDVGVVTGPAVTGGATSTQGPSSTSDKTVVNGTVARTRWGPVQVQVVITGGRITDVTALQYPTSNGRDREINAYALPRLHDRVIAAQSAEIDAVTGATVTSEGYIESLQAALDMAHFR
jgi:uncharacterized protein with FMN-binding domain